ncbi:MAG: bifunctional folylpolyglutamate synthase/dihydrofolate synthase [Firmicutes bacterium]|nr:bifunctional folylpolyglutamate synthase/dihydrofolate synthase [Bacillota bacterium]
MNYQEALDYIQSLTKFGMNFGLERISYLLERLGNPHLKVPVIHVAGTNGKGSTAVSIAAILQAAGYKVGLYISPHLVRYTERIQILDGRSGAGAANGDSPESRESGENRESESRRGGEGREIREIREIREDRFAAIMTDLKPHLDHIVRETELGQPTEFEVGTAAAFVYFAAEVVDFLVLEVGLGGRLDATNVVNPLVSVIAHIDLDHMDKLGGTLAEIAREKAAIIKPAGIAVIAPQYPEVLEVMRQAQARLLLVEPLLEPVGWDENGGTFHLRLPGNGAQDGLVGQNIPASQNGPASQGGEAGRKEVVYRALHTPLLGEHQIVNAATAVAAVFALRWRGIEVPESAIRRGLEQTRWPARLEVIRRQPTVLLDGAHNPDGMRRLCAALRDVFKYRRLICVIGILADKSVAEMVELLAPLVDVAVVTRPNSPRAAKPAQVAAHFRSRGGWREVREEPRISAAVDQALALAGAEDLVCVCGSLYLVGEARAYLAGEGSRSRGNFSYGTSQESREG